MSFCFDPFSSALRDDPYPAFRALRDAAPVHYSPEAKVWCVSRHDDVVGVLKNHEWFSSRAMMTQLMLGGEEKPPVTLGSLWFAVKLVLSARVNPFAIPNVPSLIASDGDRHSLLRSIVNRGFTPRQVSAWEKRIREITDECMQKAQSDDFDVVRDLAVPLPVTVIAEMLGIEPERRHDFKRWSDVVIDNATGAGRADPFRPAVLASFAEMTTYIVHIARKRRARPEGDLISQLVSVGSEGEGLSPIELSQFVALLLVAGNETTTNLIGNAVAALLAHPEQLARVSADPSLLPGVVEETVRFDAPVQLVFREALADVQLAGATIPKGAIVVPLIGSANRDERRFDAPDRFDPSRDVQGHVGFGFGKHFCLGASLARLEAKVALEALVPVLARSRCPEAHIPRIDSFLVRGPSRLPLRKVA